jgi:voltage-gated potassium channel
MTSRNKITFIELCLRDRHLFLLLSLLSLILITPLFEGIVELTTLMDIFITGIFLSALYAISQKGQSLRIAVGLLVPVVAGMWLTYFMHIPYLRLVGDCCAILFFAFTIILLLSFLLREYEITLDVIYGAVAVFLLMALMWAFMFDVIETLRPGSFEITSIPSQRSRIQFFYYSFVTITTVGYGDILPVSHIARAFSIVEMVVGQVYLVVLIARLVGINISQSMEKKS